MIRYALIGLFLVGLAAIVHVIAGATGGVPQGSPLAKYAVGTLSKLSFERSGEPAPMGLFVDSDGNRRGLDAFRGKTILVNYWATWCAPCEEEIPSLDALQAARGGATFEVVVLSVDATEDTDFARRRMSELGAGNLVFRQAPIDDGDLIYGAGLRGFPTTILYGPDGREIARLSASADWTSYEAIALIDAALRQSRQR